ncbi:MAG: SDR family NAD(P)-dependent oxidoreductase [Crocinitomicaceae bacterium]|nr:SDR family NAD(P)-dependent oxidoreductase [Crocinitomicaceae bacterium]
MSRTVLVTGATAGFGEAIAYKFAKDQNKIIITGRRQDRLNKVEEEIKNLGGEALSLCFDVRKQNEVIGAVKSIPEEFKSIDILVNNAGLASGLDPIQDGSTEDWDRMIDTNVKGLLYVSNEVIPLLEDGTGHIINIGSTAGKEVYPKGNVYCASKHAVDAISKGMRLDLLPRRIKVTQISPGAANTEFSTVRFHGDREKADSLYTDYEPLLAEDIAELTYYAANLPVHVCINDLVVTSLAQGNSYVFNKKK